MNNEVILPLGFVSKCHYCEEEKSFDDFVLDEEVPTNCRSHLAGDSTMICTDCMDESIKAQMYNKPLLEIGCPSCGDPWEFYVVESLVHDTTLDELKTLESSMRDRTLVPEEIPDDGASTQLLLDQGARFCPFCRWTYVKEAGCNSVICARCDRSFDHRLAFILDDGKSRQAVEEEKVQGRDSAV